jgi:trehalose 6-phosphate phosphatase
MAAIYWRDALETLGELVRTPNFGLFSDLDGTLAPIELTPEAVQISSRNLELLDAFAEELPLVALISGRRAASLQARVGLPGITYVGNHGLEHWVDGTVEVLPEAEAYLDALQSAMHELEQLHAAGVRVENKGATLSFHYRQAADPDAFAAENAEKIAEIVRTHGLVLFQGKRVFEVRPPIEVDKGTAFGELVKEAELDAAIFLGDDISDMNALRAAQQLRAKGSCNAWGVGVQSEDAPEALAEAADFLALGVDDVESLLEWMLLARRASST